MKKTNSFYIILLFLSLHISCKPALQKKSSSQPTTNSHSSSPSPRYSLAQWSFNRELFKGEMSTVDFINKAGEMGFDGVEYVNQFFLDKAEDTSFLDSLNAATNAAGIKSLLIMVDRAGDLCVNDMEGRNEAVQLHKTWVNAAKYLGCTAIRVNAHGDGTEEEMMNACLDGIGRITDYAKTQGIDVIIENHGGHSNNGAWLVQLVENLDRDNGGTLPDFNNYCLKRDNGQLWGGKCLERYDRYQGIKELLPYAKALSVKSFGFDENGYEPTIDYIKMFDLVQASGYDGYMGIEFEGHDMPSVEGIEKTRALVEKVWK